MQGRGAVQIRESKERGRLVEAFVKRVWKSPWSSCAEVSVSRTGTPVTESRVSQLCGIQVVPRTFVRPEPKGSGRFCFKKEKSCGLKFKQPSP